MTNLQEVIIVSKDHGKELIKKAIDAIPKNYPVKEERHTGFFREVTHWEGQSKPIYIAEASIESIKRPYVNKHQSGDIKLIEFRKYENEQLDSLNTRIRAGVHHIHRFDIVSRREAFIRNPNAYKYKIIDTLRRQGKDVYKVHFKNKEKLSGHVYVMDSSYAIIKADFKHHHFNGLLSLHNRQYLNYTVSYEQGEDNLWRFKHSNYKTAFKRRGKVLVLSSEYASTKIKPNNTAIAYLNRLQFDDILLNEPKKYESNFWNNYNIILPNKTYEGLFKSINYAQKEQSQKEEQPQNKTKKWIDILLRFRYETSFTWTSIDAASNNVLFVNPALDIQRSLTSSKENVYGLAYSLLYEFKPNFFLGYASEIGISKSGISSHDLSLLKHININPNKRPIFVIPGINFGYQEQKHFLGNFNATEDFNVDGKSFESGKTAIFLSQRNVRFQPNLSLSVEKSHRLDFQHFVLD